MTNTDPQPIGPTINVLDYSVRTGAIFFSTPANSKSVEFRAANGAVFNVQLRADGALAVRVRDSAIAILPEVSNLVAIHAVNLDGTLLA